MHVCVSVCVDVKSAFAAMRQWNPKGPLVSDLLQILFLFWPNIDHMKDAALKSEGRANHITVSLFLTHDDSMLSPVRNIVIPLVLLCCWLDHRKVVWVLPMKTFIRLHEFVRCDLQ